MASIFQARSFILIAYAMMFTLMGESTVAVVIFRPSKWSLAHATFYGDETASETMGIYFICYLNYHYFSLCLNHFNNNSA
jgi:hypothetical protein